MFACKIGRMGFEAVALFLIFGAQALASDITTASGEIPVAGTVTGSYLDTQSSDGVYEAIQEWETDERLEKKRTSYLEHKWTFDVPAGIWVDFYVKAYHSANSEGDDFAFAWSSDDVSYTGILQVTRTGDDGTYQSAALPGDLSGTVYVRVIDTDRTKANRSLDTVFVDHMYIETGTLNAPPAAPGNLSAAATSSSTINLSWSDNSVNEDGFYIERSLDGNTWDPLATVGADVTGFQDTNLAPATTYHYMVQAFNTYGVSDWSNAVSATTYPPMTFITEMVDPGASPYHISHAYSPVTGFPGIGYYTDGLVKFAEWNGSSWVIETVATAAGNGMDVAYAPDGSPSMCFGWGTISFAERIGSSWSVEVVENKCWNDHSSLAYDHDGNPSITYSRSGPRDRGLKFARRIGSTWYCELFDEEDRAEYKSLAFDLQGNPAIAYSGDEDGNNSISTLKLARWNGAGWNIEIVADGVTGYGLFANLAFDSTTGWPAIVHLPWPSINEDQEVTLVRWDGVAWQSEIVFSGGVLFPQLGLVFDPYGTPYVSYKENGPMLWVAHFDGIGWVRELADTNLATICCHGTAIDLSGYPSISYIGTELGEAGLKFAHK